MAGEREAARQAYAAAAALAKNISQQRYLRGMAARLGPAP
jgi:predicted RNA polymerase sigma factor